MYSRLGSRIFRHSRSLPKGFGKPKLYFLTIGGVLCLCSLKISRCEPVQEQLQSSNDVVQTGNGNEPPEKPDPVEEFITKYGPELEGVGFGGVMGICCGVAFRRLTSGIAYTIGLTFLGLQFLSYAGYININYSKAVDDVTKVLDVDGDGKLTSKDLVYAWRNLRKVLTFNLPGMGGFSAGVVMGLYFG